MFYNIAKPKSPRRRTASALALSLMVCSLSSLQATPVDTVASSSIVLSDPSDFIHQFRLTSQTHFQTQPHSQTPSAPQIVATTVSCAEVGRQSCHCNQVLPNSLLYTSYIAAPHEPRFSTAALSNTSDGTSRWDASLGTRVGIYRCVRPTRMNLDAWQIDLEGAALVRLDPQEKMDLEAADYRFGLLWTGRRDKVSYKFGYFHTSSHLGDEFLIKNPTFQRVNYVKESLIFGASLQATEEYRVYGEVAYGVIATGGAEPVQLQFGGEYAKAAPHPTRGAPFVAMNFEMRQEVDFTPGVSVLTGWQWRNPGTTKAFRVGLQFFNGPSNQYSFFQQFDSQLGLGVWYDF